MMMFKTNIKHVFIWTICLLILGLGFQFYLEHYNSRQVDHLRVITVSLDEYKTGYNRTPSSHVGIKLHGHISKAQITPHRNKTIAKLTADQSHATHSSPAVPPSKLLNRMDTATRSEFLSKVEKWRKKASSSSNNMSGDFGDGTESTYNNILRSMGYSSRLPDVINIGVKKGGTTALMFYLKHHPQIQTSLGSLEVHYFDWKYRKGIDWYRSQMKLAHDNQLVYEKTPRYFVNDAAPYRIQRDLGNNIRFLLCVRDPVSRLISDFHFTKHIRASRSWKRKQTIEMENQRFIDTMFKNGILRKKNSLVLTSNYALHFKQWLKVFKRDQFLIIDNSEMMSNLSGTLQRVESFLGLKPFFRKEIFQKTTKSQIYCIKSRSGSKCPRDISASLLPKPRLSDEVMGKLRDYYRSHNQEFEKLTGRTFAWTNL